MSLSQHTELVNLDLSNAYCTVPIYPDDQPLFAVNWIGDTFMDRALPFGLRIGLKDF